MVPASEGLAPVAVVWAMRALRPWCRSGGCHLVLSDAAGPGERGLVAGALVSSPCKIRQQTPLARRLTDFPRIAWEIRHAVGRGGSVDGFPSIYR